MTSHYSQYSQYSALISQRELLWAWVGRTVRARYKQSVLGVLWAVIQPAARAALLTIIFTYFIPIDTGPIPYIVFSYVAWVPWTLFSSGLTDMVGSLVSNMSLVSKIYFPREVLPLANLLARLLDFAIAFTLLFLLMWIYDLPLFNSNWIFLPVILLIQLMLMSGLGLAGAALNVFYRDTTHLFTFGIQLLLYATPIIYPVTRVPSAAMPYYYLNPMVGIIEAYRDVLLEQQYPGTYLAVSGVIALVCLVLAYILFKRLEFSFADVI